MEDSQCNQTEDPIPQMEIPATSSVDSRPATEEPSDRSKKKGGKRNIPKDTLDDDLREVGKEIVKAAQSFVQANNLDNDMDQCIEKLDGLEWGEYDPKYNTALMLFAENAGNRKVWLRLKSSTCESWVTSAGKKFGLFD